MHPANGIMLIECAYAYTHIRANTHICTHHKAYANPSTHTYLCTCTDTHTHVNTHANAQIQQHT